jgi:hypothetical protein
MGLAPGPLPGFVSPCKELLSRFIGQHFPTERAQAADGERRCVLYGRVWVWLLRVRAAAQRAS